MCVVRMKRRAARREREREGQEEGARADGVWVAGGRSCCRGREGFARGVRMGCFGRWVRPLGPRDGLRR